MTRSLIGRDVGRLGTAASPRHGSFGPGLSSSPANHPHRDRLPQPLHLRRGLDPGNPEGDFGLYRSGSSERKPAGDDWASIAANIDGMHCYGRAESALGLPAGVYAVRWASADAAATLVWTTSGEQQVTIPASEGLCGAGTVTASEVPTWVQAVRCDASSR